MYVDHVWCNLQYLTLEHHQACFQMRMFSSNDPILVFKQGTLNSSELTSIKFGANFGFPEQVAHLSCEVGSPYFLAIFSKFMCMFMISMKCVMRLHIFWASPWYHGVCLLALWIGLHLNICRFSCKCDVQSQVHSNMTKFQHQIIRCMFQISLKFDNVRN